MLRSLKLIAKLTGRVAERLLDLPLTLLTYIVPRSPRLWAFGSTYGTRFADNPKHLFLYCHSRADRPVRAVWLTRSPAVLRAVRELGLPAYDRRSPRGLWYALRAGVYLVDCRTMDVSAVGTRGALKVNLWHGVPLKRIERDIEQEHHAIAKARRGSWLWRTANRLLRPQLTEEYDLVLATSPASASRFRSAFGVTDDQVLTLGYPRTDPVTGATWGDRWRTAEERAVIDELAGHRRAGRRVLFYMPTFRDWNNSSSRRIPLDFAALDELLERHEALLCCKLHPSDQSGLPPLDPFPRIRVLPSTVDVYPLLAHTDALVSDYSSIFFDYLLLDRPLLFYPYDLDEYQRLSRSLYDRYEEVTPGPRATSPAELTALVGELLGDYDALDARWRTARAAVRDRFFSHVDDQASARLLDALLERAA